MLLGSRSSVTSAHIHWILSIIHRHPDRRISRGNDHFCWRSSWAAIAGEDPLNWSQRDGWCQDQDSNGRKLWVWPVLFIHITRFLCSVNVFPDTWAWLILQECFRLKSVLLMNCFSCCTQKHKVSLKTVSHWRKST